MGMGCKRSIVIQMVAVVIGLPLGLCGVFSTLFLLTTFDFQPWTIVAVALLWLAPFAIGVAWFVGVILRRKTRLDALFVPLGLAGKAYMSFFRQYHGIVYGRQAAVYLWRGPFLEIEVATPLQTRLGITQRQSDTTFFAELAGKQELALADPALSGLSVYPLDETWARALLADPMTTDALKRLTSLGSSVFTRQQVLLRPGALKLFFSGNTRMFGIDITPEQARLWVDDLVRVARAMEALPAPQVNDEISSAESLALKLRAQNPYMAIWAGVATLGFFVVMAVIIFAGVFLFTGLEP